jgi:phosphoenolpyruvate-protein phosphotransferase
VLQDLSVSAERVEEELEATMADIFRAHQEILRDVSLANEIRAEVEREFVNAEHALQRVFGRWEGKFRAMEDDTFKQRGDDMVDLGRRLLRSLTGVHAHSLEKMPEGSILIASRLLPSDTTFFSRRSAAGIIVEFGGPGSHCALLTRQMGIPGVAQVSRLMERVATGDVVLLDGLRGTVTIKPHEPSRIFFEKRMAEYKATAGKALKHSHEPAVTRDGVTIPVMANMGNRHDAEMAVENGADGAGLFRIEVLFMGRTMLPTEEELIGGISKTLAPLKGKPVYVRLLDIGGDKTLPYLPFPQEQDPFLGRRGVRVLLDYPELLDVQLRALIEVSQDHDLRIIVPMITVADDMRAIRTELERVAAYRGYGAAPPIGAMIETPAAALCADEIAAVCDFLSIGTNDLTQYTMAAGRENALVSRYFKDDHTAIFRLLEWIGRHAAGTPIGLCGELAGQSDVTEALLKTGIRMLSVPPLVLPSVKEAVRGVSIE